MNPSKVRYLVFFQYVGTKYSGVMKVPPQEVAKGILGVQNHLEKAAEKLRSITPIKFFISSRTDTGVHALCNSAHIDIERAAEKPPFSESILAQALNFHLQPEPIHVLSTHRVHDNFSARFAALSRTYVYRLATGCAHEIELPLFERDLCWAPKGGHLNLSAMEEAAQFLLGTHDFSTFRSINSDADIRSPVKTLLQADARPIASFMSHHCEHSGLRFWELEFRSQSFLYKQVRRMAGALVAVGQGRLAPYHIQELLKARDSAAYPKNIIAPACGLFLKHVEYGEADLEPGGIVITK